MLDTNLLERRINYRNFRKDKYPSIGKITEIIQEALNVAPMTTEVDQFDIDIWGPEYSELKHEFMYTLVTTTEYKKSHRIKNGTYVSDEDCIAKAKEYYKTHPHKFNRQVEAPYLLGMREESGSRKRRHQNRFIDKEQYRWADNLFHEDIAILTYAIALAANRHEVDAAFCRCFNWDIETKENDLLRKNKKPIVFLGLGYYDFDEKSLFKRDGDWIEHTEKGGRYNVVTRERDGYKKNKVGAREIINWK